MTEDEAEYLRRENKQLRSLLRRIHTATKQFYVAKDVVPRADDCPYEGILAQYHSIMYNFPQVRKLTTKRKSAIRIRWKEDLTTLEDWINYFKDASKKRFLMGQNERGWRADFDFFLREDVIAKMQEGKYG